VTSHVAWEWECVYMYKCIIHDTTRFKAVMVIGDVLICINAPFMTQRVLKPWWPWTYQNSAVKRAFAIAVPRWVTYRKVWFGGAKSGQYCVIGVGRYKWYQSHCPAWDGESVHKLMRVASGHSLGRQEWSDPMRVANGDSGSQEGVIVTSHIAWK